MIVIILLLVIIYLLAPKGPRGNHLTFAQNAKIYIVCFVVVFIFAWFLFFG